MYELPHSFKKSLQDLRSLSHFDITLAVLLLL